MIDSSLHIPGVRVDRRIAVGGMGEVFIGTEHRDDLEPRTVVVKKLLPGVNRLCHELFKREGDALSIIDSPNVIKLYRRGDDFLVLEYVDGTDLGSLLTHLTRYGEVMPLDAALAVADGLLKGLSAVHDAKDARGVRLGLVHRDINPSNILINSSGVVKIADLGVVHVAVTDQPTQAGVKGTLSYMAPEQMTSGAIDQRADLYAVGLVLYEIFTGIPARPTGNIGLSELLQARRQLPTAPSAVRNGVPSLLDAILLRALDPKAEARFESAESMRLALVDAMNQELGVSADSKTLSETIAGVTRAAMPPSQTLGTTLGVDLSTPEDAPPPQKASFRSMAWSVVLLLLIAGFAVVPRFLDEPSRQFRDMQSGVIDKGSSKDASSARDATKGASDPGVPQDSKVVATTDAVPRKADVATAPKRDGAASRKTDTRPVKRARSYGLEFSAPRGSAVYISGHSVSNGLAPRISQAITQKEQVFRVRGPKKMTAIFRLSQKRGSFRFKVGATRGEFYTVECQGKKLGPTPTATEMFKKKTQCTLSHEDGRTMTISLRKVAL